MKVIGLTGGIGSGKTTIAKMFEALGIPVYYADDEAKKLMNTSEKIKEKLIQTFGEESYTSGNLNRKYLADLVFHDKEKLAEINAIVHPEVDQHFKFWVQKQNSEYVLQENAIIFENKKQDAFDAIITVSAPTEIKIDRVTTRDTTSRENVLARINNQLNDDYKIDNSTYVIYNIDLEDSKNQVKEIHQEILAKLKA
jgi:dephospho-CoA kinase